MSHAPSDRHAWAEPGVEDLGGGVYRIPLPLGMDALRAVNVYAITDAEGVDLIDGGMAIVEAREELVRGLRQIGRELGDIRNFFVTHVHIDHYSLAVELRKTLHNVVTLGAEERANLVALREVRTQIGHGFGGDLHRLGAAELSPTLARTAHPAGHGFSSWEDPDRWLADQAELDLRSRTLTAYHTPGHTRGHVIFHDPAAAIIFARRPRAAAHHPVDRVRVGPEPRCRWPTTSARCGARWGCPTPACSRPTARSPAAPMSG